MKSQRTPHRTVRVLLTLAALALPQGRLAAAQSGDFTYTHPGGEATITGYSGSGGPVYIPSSIGGFPVVGIGEGAFEGISSITSLIVSNGPASIGTGAFNGCAGLTNVILPDSVTSLGGGAFGGCYSLTGLTLGSGLANIGDYAFEACSALTNLALPASVTSIGDEAFDGTGITNVVIPAGVASIGTNAFGDCGMLAGVTVALGNRAYASSSGVLFDKAMTTLIQYPTGKPDASYAVPAGVKDIAYQAFSGCSNLVSVTLPNSLTNIEDAAFSECPALVSVTLPDSLANIGDVAFSDCPALASINIPGHVSAIGIGAFEGTAITNIVIPDSVASIGNDLCVGCVSLTNAVIGAGVASIAEAAFGSCTRLASVSLSAGLTNIADTAFNDCPLASLTIPDTVLSIGDNAFDGSKLVSVSLPDSVKSVGSTAFAGNPLLSSVSIGSGLTNLGSNAFLSAGVSNISVSAANPRFIAPGGVLIDKVQEVLLQYPARRPGATYTVPDGITELAQWSFSYASNLTSVTIPASVTSIGEWAFELCWRLTNVTVLGDLASVGLYAFGSCPNVAGFYFAGDAPTNVNTGAFDTGSSFTVYYVSSTLGWTQFLRLNGFIGATWTPSGQAPLISGFAPQNKVFGFTVAVAPNTTVVVEACTNLSSPVWTALATNAPSSGTFSFSDPDWKNFRGRFYRARLP